MKERIKQLKVEWTIIVFSTGGEDFMKLKIDNEAELKAALTEIVNATVISIPKHRFFEMLREIMDAPALEYLKESAKEKQITHKCANCSKEGLKHIEAIIEGQIFWLCSHECMDRFEALLKAHKEELITKDDRLDIELNSENSRTYAPVHLTGY